MRGNEYTLETLHGNPAGSPSRPTAPGQQSAARPAWSGGDPGGEAWTARRARPVLEPRTLCASQEPTSASPAGAAPARPHGRACPVRPGHPPGRRRFAPAGERVPALRAGRLVRAGREAAPSWPCLPDPVGGRLRPGVHSGSGRPQGAGGIADAVRHVRADRPPDQNPSGAVATAPGRDGSRCARVGQPSRDVRLPRLHPLLGAVADGNGGGAAPDGRAPVPWRDRDARRVVREQRPPADRGATRDPEPEPARARGVLRDHRERPRPGAPVAGRAAGVAAVVVPPFVGGPPPVGVVAVVGGALAAAAAGRRPFAVPWRCAAVS